MMDRVKHAKISSAVTLAKSRLLPFAIGMNAAYDSAWHLRLIARKLEQLEARKVKRLMVFMPPRHGKSFLISQMFPAWYLGRNPDHRVIFTTYSDGLAGDFGREVRNLMASDQYQAVFEGIRLAADSSAANKFHTNQGGVYYAVGANGPLTGRGGNLIIIDDIHKNREEANSPTFQKRIHNWFGSTLYTRLMPDGVVVLVQTRWCENDLPGYILKELKDQEWDVLSLPALRDETVTNPRDKRELEEALWPEWFPRETLLDIKKTLGTSEFTSLYQQRPTALEGGIIKRKWLRNFYTEKPARFDEMVISADFTFKDTMTADFAVIGVWGRVGADKYLLDVWRERAGFIDSCAALKSMSAKWPKAFAKLVEDKANGSAIIESLKKTVPGIIPYSPKDSKQARLSACSPDFEAGNIWLPDSSIAPWLHDYIHELTVFPNGANDDQVDMTTQALLRFRSKSTDYLKNLTRM